MTEHIDRDALRKLADAATEGPWEARECLPARPHDFAVVLPDEGRDLPAAYITDWCVTGPDAAFIAAARTAVPALLDALDHADLLEEQLLTRNRNLLDAVKSAEAERDYRRRENEELSIALNLALTGEEVQTGERYSNAVALAQAIRRADRAEARIKAVRDVLDDPRTGSWTPVDQIATHVRRALDG